MEAPGPPTDVRARLTAARAKLDARDLPGALALYEEVLASAGQRADVLLTVSGDLGSTGNVAAIIDLVAPRYDARRHGPAIGLNLLQAYIAVRNAEAAQHVLDILFALDRPELEERLFGFSNAIAEIALASGETGSGAWDDAPPPAGAEAPQAFSIALVNLTKPIWFYGLDAMQDRVLPPKEGKPRRAAFAQLALPELKEHEQAMRRPEEELGLLSRAIPLWLSEAFYHSPHYAAQATLGFVDQPDGSRLPMLFWAEWNTENIRQLVESAPDGLDYLFTGSLRHRAGDYELVLRVWEVRKFRERKQFTARWTPATADAELARLQSQILQFMEWKPYPAGAGLPYAPPAAPRAWLDALGVSGGLFLVEKKIFPPQALPPAGPRLAGLAAAAGADAKAALCWLTAQARARALGIEFPPQPALLSDPLVAEAARLLGGA